MRIRDDAIQTFRPSKETRLAALVLALGAVALGPAGGAAAGAVVPDCVVVQDPHTFTATAFCPPQDLVGTVVIIDVRGAS
jgi:hypothetical protein